MGSRRSDGFIDPKKERREKQSAVIGLSILLLVILAVIVGAFTGKI